MSDRYFEILRESGHKGNYIPSGRQLPRTPPLMDVKRHLDFCNDDPSEDCEAPQQNMEVRAEIIRLYLIGMICNQIHFVNRQVPESKTTKTGRLMSALLRQKQVPGDPHRG